MIPPVMPLESGLPVAGRAGSSKWRLRDESWRVAVSKAAEAIARPEGISPANLFKRGPRRLVFRLEEAPPGHSTAMVKAFPLDTLRHRWRHTKYGRAEAVNLLIARQRGLPVPALFAFGWRRDWGLVSWNALIMEFLNGRPMKEHLLHAPEPVQRELLWRVLPLFQKIFETGCNHIDLGPHAILLGESGEHDSIIDFQYCRFLNEPAPMTFAAQAGYFGWCLTTHWNLLPGDMVIEWFGALTGSLSLGNRPALEKIFLHRLVHKASIRERLAV